MLHLQSQVLSYVSSLLGVVLIGAISYATPFVKKWITNHLPAQEAQVADSVLNNLGTIVKSVVGNFNVSVVNDLKATKLFTPEAAAIVKQDALTAIKSQGAHLIALGKTTVGDIESWIEAELQNAVATAPTRTVNQTPKTVPAPSPEPTNKAS